MRPNTPHPLLLFSEEVRDALACAGPVVALESNVLAHGLRHPDNIATALRVEQAVRDNGATPATIAIDRGRILVGLSREQIDRFGSTADIPKVSSRDMGVALAGGQMGATTVASSIVAAHLAAIPFFASAGIGGVHRGAERTMDVSSDLIQFTRSRVAVVCAGAKSILDLGLTLEFLETHCIPVIAYRSEDFPAFFCRSSGFASPQRLDDDASIVRSIELQWSIGYGGSVLITSPIDAEAAVPFDDVEDAVKRAVREAESAGVRGNALTKLLMRAVDAATHGRSSSANASVLIGTAEVAGRLAAAWARASRAGAAPSNAGGMPT